MKSSFLNCFVSFSTVMFCAANFSGCKFFGVQSQQKSFSFEEETLQEINIAPYIEKNSLSSKIQAIQNPKLVPDFVLLLEQVPVCYVRTSGQSPEAILETKYPISLGALTERLLRSDKTLPTANKMVEAIEGLGKAVSEEITEDRPLSSSSATVKKDSASVDSSTNTGLNLVGAPAAAGASAVAAAPVVKKLGLLAGIPQKRIAFQKALSHLGKKVSPKKIKQVVQNLAQSKVGQALKPQLANAAKSMWTNSLSAGGTATNFCRNKPVVCAGIMAVAGTYTYASHWINSSSLSLTDIEQFNILQKVPAPSSISSTTAIEEQDAVEAAEELNTPLATNALNEVVTDKSNQKYIEALDKLEVDDREVFELISAQIRTLGSEDKMNLQTTCESLYAQVDSESNTGANSIGNQSGTTGGSSPANGGLGNETNSTGTSSGGGSSVPPLR
jgi:hypothetical protein